MEAADFIYWKISIELAVICPILGVWGSRLVSCVVLSRFVGIDHERSKNWH